MKIKHTTLMFTDLSQMDEIPSELLEPYLVTFMSYIIESVGCGWKKPDEARSDLKGVERFISLFGGLHCRLAASNVFYKFTNLKDEEMISICKQTTE